ncbi:hypothetical protein ABI59_19360 [Acidobacteria bacterium Mor1]|nr:hypothetical protein ABI59_19360 [Acidobacteria bacterium Mor1]
MSDRERNELALSSLIDQELDSIELLPTIDHLVDDPLLQDFWREARALDALALDEAAGKQAPAAGSDRTLDRVWDRIESGATPEAEVTPFRRRDKARNTGKAAWLMAAAAMLLVAFGAYQLGSVSGPAADGGGAVIAENNADQPVPFDDNLVEVRLGGDPAVAGAAGMTDERFVRMTVELLSADARYHRKMQEILDAVVDEPDEGSRERTLGFEVGDQRGRSLLETAAEAEAQDRRML